MANEKLIKKLLEHYGKEFLHDLRYTCRDPNDGSLFLAGLSHDVIRMLHSILKPYLDEQQRKAALKATLDAVLLDYGMSVQIHEFKQSS